MDRGDNIGGENGDSGEDNGGEAGVNFVGDVGDTAGDGFLLSRGREPFVLILYKHELFVKAIDYKY